LRRVAPRCPASEVGVAGVVKPLAVAPAIIVALAANLGPVVLITALAVLTLVAAVVFFPSDVPTRRLTQSLTAVRQKGARENGGRSPAVIFPAAADTTL
jgi:hypothetical protein